MMHSLRSTLGTAALLALGIAVVRAAQRSAHASSSSPRRDERSAPDPFANVPIQRVPPAPMSRDLEFDGGATARPMGNDPGFVPGPADHVRPARVDQTGLGRAADPRAYGPTTGDTGVLYGEAAIATGDVEDDGTPGMQGYVGDDGESWTEALRQSTSEFGARGGTTLDRVAKAKAPAPSEYGAAADEEDTVRVQRTVDDLAPETPSAPDGEKPVADRGSAGPSGL